MTKKDTWFDAFFDAVTTSNEFKKVVEKDWKWDLWDALKKMEASVAKAWDITKAFENTFGTPEAMETGHSLTTNDTPKPTADKSVKNAWDDDSRKISVVPEYFTMKNPDTWGFKWVAGMQKLSKGKTSGRSLRELWKISSGYSDWYAPVWSSRNWENLYYKKTSRGDVSRTHQKICMRVWFFLPTWNE